MTPDELWSILHSPVDQQCLFYRLYHDEQGVPLYYSMEDLPGTYIELTQEQYNQGASNIRIRNNSIVELTWETTSKLVPAESGTCCAPCNVSIVVAVQESHIKWNKKIYENN
jgi:hypothetical protein